MSFLIKNIEFLKLKKTRVDPATLRTKWRIMDKKWNLLPQEVLDRIIFLNLDSQKEIENWFSDLDCLHGMSLKTDCFEKIVEETIKGDASNFLKSLDFEPDQEMCLNNFSTDIVCILPWQIFVDYWEDFYYPSDDILIFDQKGEHLLFVTHDQDFQYGELKTGANFHTVEEVISSKFTNKDLELINSWFANLELSDNLLKILLNEVGFGDNGKGATFYSGLDEYDKKLNPDFAPEEVEIYDPIGSLRLKKIEFFTLLKEKTAHRPISLDLKQELENKILLDFSDFLPHVREFYWQIPAWWKENFKQEKLENYTLISQGQSNICFEINGKYILKIYASKYRYGQANEAKLQKTFQTLKKFDQDFATLNFIPKNLGFYENDQTFGTNLVLMEKVEAVDLFEIFYKFDQKEQTTLFEQSLWQLRKLHYSQTKQEQTYSTKEYLDQTLTEISANLEKIKDKIPKDLEAQIHKIIQKYKFKELRENFYLLHNDFHLANVLINQQSKLFFIDLDRSILGPIWLEMETILDMIFFPKGMATLELEPFYGDPLLHLLPTFGKIYPELLLSERLEEIKISFLRTIMGKLGSSSFRKQAMETFKLVFEQQILENLG